MNIFLYKAVSIAGDVDPKAVWSMEKMQAYLSLIKTINPELTADAIRWWIQWSLNYGTFWIDSTSNLYDFNFDVLYGIRQYI